MYILNSNLHNRKQRLWLYGGSVKNYGQVMYFDLVFFICNDNPLKPPFLLVSLKNFEQCNNFNKLKTLHKKPF